jgi:phosphomevalonate kinase
VSAIFAPGKLFVLGEWAVLEGAEALLVPVPAGQEAQVEPLDAEVLELLSPEFSPHARRWRWEASGWSEEPGPGWGAGLDVVGEVVARAPRRGGRRVTLRARGLFVGAGEGRRKLGFGSSAAVAAAVARALCEDAEAALALALAGHAAAQGGRGSGADVVTSALGRAVVFARGPRWRLAPPPEGLGLLAVWTGQEADTRALMAAMEGFARADAAGYRAAMARVEEAARCGIGAWGAGDVAGVLAAARRSAQALAWLGEAAGIEIEVAAHRALGAALAAHGERVAWKPSGAGGGDLALVLVEGDAAPVEASLAAQGYLSVKVL